MVALQTSFIGNITGFFTLSSSSQVKTGTSVLLSKLVITLVCNATKCAYLNNTVAYAIAYALWSKVGRIDLFGIDFSYKENMHFAEAGRACVEFWISKCMENDILVGMSGRSTVLDSNVPATEKLYGFHRLEKPLVAIPHEGKFIIGPYDEINKELEKQGLKINEDVAPPEPYKG